MRILRTDISAWMSEHVWSHMPVSGYMNYDIMDIYRYTVDMMEYRVSLPQDEWMLVRLEMTPIDAVYVDIHHLTLAYIREPDMPGIYLDVPYQAEIDRQMHRIGTHFR